MGAGERRDRSFEDVPILRAASRRTRRRLRVHAERVRLPDGAVVVERARPVRWVALPVRGTLRGAGRSWGSGEAVFLGEGLLHGAAPETVVADGPVEAVLVPVRALTAALSTDAAFGLAVARALAASPPAARRTRGFEHRRPEVVATRRAA